MSSRRATGRGRSLPVHHRRFHCHASGIPVEHMAERFSAQPSDPIEVPRSRAETTRPSEVELQIGSGSTDGISAGKFWSQFGQLTPVGGEPDPVPNLCWIEAELRESFTGRQV